MSSPPSTVPPLPCCSTAITPNTITATTLNTTTITSQNTTPATITQPTHMPGIFAPSHSSSPLHDTLHECHLNLPLDGSNLPYPHATTTASTTHRPIPTQSSSSSTSPSSSMSRSGSHESISMIRSPSSLLLSPQGSGTGFSTSLPTGVGFLSLGHGSILGQTPPPPPPLHPRSYWTKGESEGGTSQNHWIAAGNKLPSSHLAPLSLDQSEGGQPIRRPLGNHSIQNRHSNINYLSSYPRKLSKEGAATRPLSMDISKCPSYEDMVSFTKVPSSELRVSSSKGSVHSSSSLSNSLLKQQLEQQHPIELNSAPPPPPFRRDMETRASEESSYKPLNTMKPLPAPNVSAATTTNVTASSPILVPSIGVHILNSPPTPNHPSIAVHSPPSNTGRHSDPTAPSQHDQQRIIYDTKPSVTPPRYPYHFDRHEPVKLDHNEPFARHILEGVNRVNQPQQHLSYTSSPEKWTASNHAAMSDSLLPGVLASSSSFVDSDSLQAPPSLASSSSILCQSHPIPSDTFGLNFRTQKYEKLTHRRSLEPRNRATSITRRPSHDSISPVTSASYSSVSPSPAVSFLARVADKTVPRYDEPGVYNPGDQIGFYYLNKEIGRGTFSKVFEATVTDAIDKEEPNLVAVKIVRKSQQLEVPAKDESFVLNASAGPPSSSSSIQSPQSAALAKQRQQVQLQLDHEASIWSRLKHPNILQMVDFMDLDDAVVVIAEYADGGTLLDYITSRPNKRLSEDEARFMFRQIVQGVRYLHVSAKVVHRDLKLENILLSRDLVVKIADFGLSDYIPNHRNELLHQPSSDLLLQSQQQSVSSILPDEGSDTGSESSGIFSGSLQYCAPEDLRTLNTRKHPSSDIWSLGCILYAMLTGCLPFQDDYLPRLQMTIMNGRYDAAGRLEGASVSIQVKNLIARMLSVDPQLRPNIVELAHDSWVTCRPPVPAHCGDEHYGDGC